jgi:hypothetical protein
MRTSELVLALIGAVSLLATDSAMAGGSTQHFSRGLTHSGQAVGHSMAGGAQLVSAAVAVPLIVSGHVGELATQLGEGAWDAATSPTGTSLPMTDDVITAGPPPDRMLRGEEKEQ